ncbi:MAG: zf-TFIIB domain-containing protein [Prolixibacteraceae bacterium]|nr:zf-TFIIB domain-containing protein [Prolixibacteraceae bacterium]
MKCPNCKDVNLVMTDRSGIEIDYCPECRGVWLDRGELDKIIERSAQNFKNPQDDMFHGKQYHSNDYDYRYKKKKGLLGELFDF